MLKQKFLEFKEDGQREIKLEFENKLNEYL